MIKKSKYLFSIALAFFSLLSHSQSLQKRTKMLMGSRFSFTIVANDSSSAQKFIDSAIAEVSRIEYLISDWKPQTQISEVNRNAGIKPIKVDKEVFDLTKRAIHFSEITNGAFDISFAAMERIWKFDGSMTEMPSAESIKRSVEKVGYKNIILDSLESTVFLKLPGMKIGFGALGEGYAADRCRDLLIKKGIKSGIINGSGDIRTWGNQPDGSKWKIGITDPFNNEEIFAVVPLEDEAVTTSGSYEKFITLNGKRYSHIINPKTGYPATGLISVTVFGPSAETANGFSTSIMVLGKKKGLKLIKKFPEYKCIIISDKGKVFTSKNISRKMLKEWKKKID